MNPGSCSFSEDVSSEWVASLTSVKAVLGVENVLDEENVLNSSWWPMTFNPGLVTGETETGQSMSLFLLPGLSRVEKSHCNVSRCICTDFALCRDGVTYSSCEMFLGGMLGKMDFTLFGLGNEEERGMLTRKWPASSLGSPGKSRPIPSRSGEVLGVPCGGSGRDTSMDASRGLVTSLNR
jgi:hypothetical protein